MTTLFVFLLGFTILVTGSQAARADFESRVFASNASPFVIRTQDDFVTLHEDKTPVFRYVRGEILAEGVPEDRRRSTYIHPLYTLDGENHLTDDFPEDHHHHRGVSWMWQKVIYDGVTRDLWHLQGIHQHHNRIVTPVLHEDKAVFRVRNGWIDQETKKRVIDEWVTITVHRATDIGRVFDYELRLTAQDTPVTIGTSETGYSGLCARMRVGADLAITTSSGPLTADEDRQPHRWVDYSLRLDNRDKVDGLTVMDHESNPNSPPGWTLRFYGFVNPAFTSRTGDYTIEPDTTLTLRYRLLVHEGGVSPDIIEELYEEFNKAE